MAWQHPGARREGGAEVLHMPAAHTKQAGAEILAGATARAGAGIHPASSLVRPVLN